MAGTAPPPQLMAYRCPKCNRTEVRVTPREDESCPKCGSEQHVRVTVVGHALGYSITERRKGPTLHDTRLGSMAYFFGWMTLQQIAACLQIQRQIAEKGKQPPRFGEAAVSGGFMTEQQVDTLLHVQAIHRPGGYDNTFGGIAVHRGLVKQEDVDACLEEQRHLLRTRYEAPFLGLMLMEKKLLTPDQVKQILELQAKVGELPPGMELTVAFRPAVAKPPTEEAAEPKAKAEEEDAVEAEVTELPRARVSDEPARAPEATAAEELPDDELELDEPGAPATVEEAPAEKAEEAEELAGPADGVSVDDLLAEDEAGEKPAVAEAPKPEEAAEGEAEDDAARSVLGAMELEEPDFAGADGSFIEEGVGDAFDQLPAEVTADTSVAEVVEEVRERFIPPPPKPGERRIVCRCESCGHAEIHTKWRRGEPCPECDSVDYQPVPVEEGALGYTIADRSAGPSIEDGRLGRLATYAGWATQEEVKRCLDIQQKAADSGERVRPFGEVAVEEGLLTKKQVDALLRIQGIHRPKDIDMSFGAVAVRSGFITQAQLDETLDEQADLLRDNQEAPLLGMMLEEKRYLTPNQVKAILDLQEQYNRGALAAIHGPRERHIAEVAVEELKEAVSKKRNWMYVVLAILLVLSGAAIATGWFGFMGWAPPEVVAGCRSCGEIVAMPPQQQATVCPECHQTDTLCPIAQCEKCGHYYLYGVRGSGTRCPKCGSGLVRRLASEKEARVEWKFEKKSELMP